MMCRGDWPWTRGTAASPCREMFRVFALHTGDGSIVYRAQPGTAMTDDWDITTGDGAVVVVSADGLRSRAGRAYRRRCDPKRSAMSLPAAAGKSIAERYEAASAMAVVSFASGPATAPSG